MVPCGCFGDGSSFAEVDTDRVEIYEVESHLLGHSPHEVSLGDQFLAVKIRGNTLTGAIVLIEHHFDVLERYPLTINQGLGQRRKQGGDGGGIGVDAVAPLLLTLLFLEGGHRLGHQVGGQICRAEPA